MFSHANTLSPARCSQRHQSLIANFRPKPSNAPKMLHRGNRPPCRPRCVILTRDAKTCHPAWSARSSPCPQRALHGAVPQPCPRPRRSVAGHKASTRMPVGTLIQVSEADSSIRKQLLSHAPISMPHLARRPRDARREGEAQQLGGGVLALHCLCDLTPAFCRAESCTFSLPSGRPSVR